MIAMSKYIFVLFILLYTLDSFRVLLCKRPEEKRAVYVRQLFEISVIHIFAFCVLYVKSQNFYYLIYGFVSLLLLYAFLLIYRSIYKKQNKLLVYHICFLLSNGFIMISRINTLKATRQLIFATLALCCIMLVPVVVHKFRFLKNLSGIYSVVGIGALIGVLIMAETINGAKIAVNIYGFTFQPSEFIKIIFALNLASLLYKNAKFVKVSLSSLITCVYVLVLVASRDLGSALIFAVVFVCVLYVASGKPFYFWGSCILFVLAALVAYVLFSHVKVRVDIWMNPWQDIEGKGYQIIQALFSMGMGGWFGSGLFGGMPRYIPYVEADMIFPAFVEEFGMIYGICLILICLNCFFQFMKIALLLKDRFYKLLATGLSVTYLFQVLLTIGGSTKYIPLTGVTLPFVSYGGSSVLTTGILFAFFEGLYLVHLKELQDNEEAIITDSLIDCMCDEDEEDDDFRTESNFESDNGRHEIVYLMFGFTIVFIGLISYLIVFLVKDSGNVIKNEYNVGRVDKKAECQIRGSIFASHGETLAVTLKDDTGNLYRSYPYGEVFSHVVGYHTHGKSGIERSENFYLSMCSESALEQIKAELKQNKLKAYDVVTTLDVTLQQAAYDLLGEYTGAIIVTRPKTGEVLAMVSNPGFNPNQLDDIWGNLSESQKESSVFLNRATEGLYPPGSTFKIFTLLEYMRENPELYNDYTYECSGTFLYEPYSIHCYNHKAHGVLTLKDGLAKSCNCMFADIVLNLHMNSFADTLSGMLFGKFLPIDIAYEKSRVTVNEELTVPKKVQLSIGQGDTLVTPLHISLITSAIANKGELMKPVLVDYVLDAYGNVVEDSSATVYEVLMSEEESQFLSECMRETVVSGTAKGINEAWYAAGKTGSAEYSSNSDSSHAWFTGFAPFDNPEICVTVLLEGAGTGGSYAVPIADKLFEIYFNL